MALLTIAVEDSGANPIEGASITGDLTGTTDVNGEYSEEVVDGDYTVTVSADGYDDETTTVTVAGSDVTETVTLVETTYTLTITVTSDDGRLLDGATISGDLSGTTDANGEYSEEVTAGDYTVTASAEDYDDETTTVTVDSATSETLTLARTRYTLTVSVLGPGPSPIEGATVSADRGDTTQTTDASGEAALDLLPGEHRLSITAEGYLEETDTVTVEQADDTREYLLTPRYDPPGNGDYQETTDAEGRATFEDLPTREYVYEAGKHGYDTRTGTLSHLGEDERDLSLVEAYSGTDIPDDEGIDAGAPYNPHPDLTLPGTDAYFELAPVSAQADDTFRIPLLVVNASGQSGATAVRLESEDGTLIDRNVTSLAPAGYRILWFSVRSAFESIDEAVPVTARTNDQDITFDLTFAEAPDEILGYGRPFTLGGRRPATLGGRLPGTLGQHREREVTIEEGIARRENNWALTLENPAGERKHLPIVADPNPQRTHTEMSDWEAAVPTDPELHEWTFNTRVWLTHDERLTFTGWCRQATSDEERTTLSGTGPAGELNNGSYEFEFTSMAEWRAIEQVISEVAPEWDWHVVRPADPAILYNETVSGTAIECITQIHKDYGMRYLIDHRKFRRAISFPPGGVVSDASFPVIDNESRDRSMEGYANRADVLGGIRENGSGKYHAEYADTDEIRRLAAELGIQEEEATRTYPVRDPKIESGKQAKQRAKGEVRERAENLELSGSFDVPAQLVEPGLEYTMPWDDDRIVGSHALGFGGRGYVEIDLLHMPDFRDSGAITMWARAEWSDLEDREARLFGTDASGETAGISTIGADTLTFDVEGVVDVDNGETGDEDPTNTEETVTASVDMYPDDSPPDGEWIPVAVDWAVENGVTTLRAISEAGVETTTFEGVISMPSTLYLGRHLNDYYSGALEYVQLWADPLPLAYYDLHATGQHVPATTLIARYPMNESGSGSRDVVHDVIGGHHGERFNTTVIGNPQTLHSVSFADGKASLQYTRKQTRRGQLQKLFQEVNRLKR